MQGAWRTARALPQLIGARPEFAPGAGAIGCCNGAMNVTAKQFLKDLAFTFGAALATGAIVGAVSFTVVRVFAG
jgi:hypothetical protein